jgi:hypothetical protein
MNRAKLQTLLGAAAMGWGGASITAALGFTGWKQVNVALFAVGIVLLGQAPLHALHARIARLEKAQQPQDGGTVASLG